MKDLTRSEEDNGNGIAKIGSVARRTTALIIIGIVLSIGIVVLGVLSYRNQLTAEPFLLLVGIAIGFVLGIFFGWL